MHGDISTFQRTCNRKLLTNILIFIKVRGVRTTKRLIKRVFKGHLGINSTDQVGKREAKLIAGFIYGDLGFRLPSYEQSLTYANGKGI